MQYRYARIYRGRVRAVITDLAGTTVDFGSCAPAEAFVALFAQQGIEITPTEARGPMGLHKRDHIAALAALPSVAAQWEKLRGQPCGESDIDAMYEAFIPLQVACLPKYAAPIDGVLSTMEALRAQGIQIAATTGYNREMMNTVVAAARAEGFAPDVAVCAEDVAEGRPGPWMNYRAMEALGVFPREGVIAIGDTIPDIEAGLNAGVWTVGVTATGNMLGLNQAEYEALNAGERGHLLAEAEDRMFAAGAHFVIPAFSDLPELVATLNRAVAQGKRP